MNVSEIMRRWPDQEAAVTHLERVRWGGKPTCPYCGSDRVGVHLSKDKKMPRWQCYSCHRAFSATVGTIFHHTHLALQTWFMALAIVMGDGVSAAQLGRDLDLPYKTAWSLISRIRNAIGSDPVQEKLFHNIISADPRRADTAARLPESPSRIGSSTCQPS